MSWTQIRKHHYFWHGAYGVLSALGWFIIKVVSGDISSLSDLQAVGFQSIIAAGIGAGLRYFQERFITGPEKAKAAAKELEERKRLLMKELLDHGVNTVPAVEQLKELGWPSSWDDLDLQFVNLRGAQLPHLNFTLPVPEGKTVKWWQEHGPKNARVLNWNVRLTCVDSPSSDWSGANLLAANLTGAMLFRCKLVNAHLQRTNLSYADLRGADLTGANTTGIILTGVQWDEYTTLPGGEKCTSQAQFESISSFAYVAPVLMKRMQAMTAGEHN